MTRNEDQQLLKSIQDFLSAASGTNISMAAARGLLEDPEIKRVLRDDECRKVLTDPEIRKKMVPHNFQDISLRSAFLNAVGLFWTTGGGKNSKHKNPKSKDSAQKKYEEAKKEYDALNSKPNRTKDENEKLKKLKKQKEHWRKKAEEQGEHHSQRAKGQSGTARTIMDGGKQKESVFTVVMEYEGGTYLSQVRSSDVQGALEKWATDLDCDTIQGMTTSSRQAVLDDIEHEEPALVQGLKNTWACCVLTDNHVAVLHIVRTEEL